MGSAAWTIRNVEMWTGSMIPIGIVMTIGARDQGMDQFVETVMTTLRMSALMTAMISTESLMTGVIPGMSRLGMTTEEIIMRAAEIRMMNTLHPTRSMAEGLEGSILEIITMTLPTTMRPRTILF